MMYNQSMELDPEIEEARKKWEGIYEGPERLEQLKQTEELIKRIDAQLQAMNMAMDMSRMEIERLKIRPRGFWEGLFGFLGKIASHG
jgi:septal ring factor EnvC (AmiA/AmiB activator)